MPAPFSALLCKIDKFLKLIGLGFLFYKVKQVHSVTFKILAGSQRPMSQKLPEHHKDSLVNFSKLSRNIHLKNVFLINSCTESQPFTRVQVLSKDLTVTVR